MPAQYTIYPDLNLKYVEISGKTHLYELRDLAEQYFQDPQFDIEHRFLVDLTDLVNARSGFLDVFSLHGFYKRKYGLRDKPVQVAIVAPSDLAYGISRMFSALMAGRKIMWVQIFDDIDSASGWLELDPKALHAGIAEHNLGK